MNCPPSRVRPKELFMRWRLYPASEERGVGRPADPGGLEATVRVRPGIFRDLCDPAASGDLLLGGQLAVHRRNSRPGQRTPEAKKQSGEQDDVCLPLGPGMAGGSFAYRRRWRRMSMRNPEAMCAIFIPKWNNDPEKWSAVELSNECRKAKRR